jgi:hypothetical protein
VETWAHLRTPEAQRAFVRWPEPEASYRLMPFPLATVVVLTPAALTAAAGVGAASGLAAAGLLGFTLWRDARLTWAMLVNMFAHG